MMQIVARTAIVLSIALLGSFPILAQIPTAAAVSPSIAAGLDYSRTQIESPSSTQAGMNGFDGSMTVHFRAHFAVTADIGYVRASNVFGSGQTTDMLTYMIGPAFYFRPRPKVQVYARALFGGDRETGVIRGANGGFLTAYARKPALGFGVGIERSIWRSVAIHAGADYLRTSFFGPTEAPVGQNNVRLLVGFVYRFGGKSEK